MREHLPHFKSLEINEKLGYWHLLSTIFSSSKFLLFLKDYNNFLRDCLKEQPCYNAKKSLILHLEGLKKIVSPFCFVIKFPSSWIKIGSTMSLLFFFVSYLSSLRDDLHSQSSIETLKKFQILGGVWEAILWVPFNITFHKPYASY